MKHYLLHLPARIRAFYALLAFSAVSLSVDAQETTTYSVGFSNTQDFNSKVEVPMVAAACCRRNSMQRVLQSYSQIRINCKQKL